LLTIYKPAEKLPTQHFIGAANEAAVAIAPDPCPLIIVTDPSREQVGLSATVIE